MHTPEDIDRMAGDVISALNTSTPPTEQQIGELVVMGIGLVATFLKCQVRQTHALEAIAFEMQTRREQGR